MSRRALTLAAIVAACVGAGGAYVASAALDSTGTTSDARPRVVVAGAGAATSPTGRRGLVRAVDYGNPRLNGRLFEIAQGSDRAVERAGRLACERVYVGRSGDGLCLAVKPSGLAYEAIVFDQSYRSRASFAIPGVPDRARVSPDGRYGAFTAFLQGHTYSAGVRQFSVHTAIVDMAAGEPLFSLDELEITRDGERFERADANLWGVTFAGGDRFYATLGTGGSHYLLEARVSTRRARVVREGIECPSLSPDGTRIAYKRRVGKRDAWHLHVLDLATGEDVRLAERRSIDDQPEWLGDEAIVYSDDRSVLTVPADGSGESRRLVGRASSPVALRE